MLQCASLAALDAARMQLHGSRRDPSRVKRCWKTSGAYNRPTMQINFDNSYAAQLEGAFVPWRPAASPEPRLLRLNRALAQELGIDPDLLGSAQGLAMLAGNDVPANAQPIAQAYAGHQFGGFSPQLGDGRALLLGEVIDRNGQRRDIAFKGSGRTPFSRGGDGKAAVGPVLREYLIGEAMYALGIPTTRALAAVATGETVYRDWPLPGAILTRVAASHLRVGTFQYFAARREHDQLRRIADYAISRHDPQLAGRDDRYQQFLDAVIQRQAALVAQWMGVGFIHGVMNTDNMTISGETIDYGPCAFLEAYDPATVFSSIDTQGRYAYGRQPGMAQWNLARLAESLLPLIHADADTAVKRATDALQAFPDLFHARWLAVFCAKLGVEPDDMDADTTLIQDFLELLQAHRVDFTLGFRSLNAAAAGQLSAVDQLLDDQGRAAFAPWLQCWQARRARTSNIAALTAAMKRANPAVIARNHRVEEALAAAVEQNNMAPFERLLAALEQPFDERDAEIDLRQPAPAEQTACYKTFCGT